MAASTRSSTRGATAAGIRRPTSTPRTITGTSPTAGPAPGTVPSLGIPTHEIGHIVEGASNGVHESPAFGLWKDSKWIELYQYDLFVGLGLKDEARRAFDRFTAQSDDFPRPGPTGSATTSIRPGAIMAARG